MDTELPSWIPTDGAIVGAFAIWVFAFALFVAGFTYVLL